MGASNGIRIVSLAVTITFVIVFFELVPERTIWLIPIKPEEEHMFASPGAGGFYVLLMQKRTQTKDDEYHKQYHRSRRILVVDNEPDITSSFKQALRNKGFELETANDPLLALKKFKAGSYDLLIIDIVMPEMDGFGLYEEIRKIDNKVKVCFITTFEINYQALRAVFPAATTTVISAAGIVAAAVSPWLISTFGTQFYGKPRVNILITPNVNNDARRGLIMVTNDGAVPATNLSLLVLTPKKIINITNEFNTTAIMLPQFRTSLAMHKPQVVNVPFIDMKIRKFAAGNGSIIKIGTLIKSAPRPFYYNYTVFGTYDQGSSHSIVLRPLGPLDQLGVFFSSFIGQLYLIAIFAYGYGYYVLYILYYKKKQAKRRLVIDVRLDLVKVRSTIKKNSYWADRFYSYRFYSYRFNIINRSWGTFPERRKVQVFSNAYDYIRVADFYTKVDERDNYIATQSDMTLPETMNKLIQYNDECLYLAEDALTRIDWTMYKT